MTWCAQGSSETGLDECQTLEKMHGRMEARHLVVTEDIDWIREKDDWSGLRSIAMLETEREVIGGKTTTERRYFINSLAANAAQILTAVCGHWAIENSLHWCLDVSYREDA